VGDALRLCLVFVGGNGEEEGDSVT
jgi:hypothetical protein